MTSLRKTLLLTAALALLPATEGWSQTLQEALAAAYSNNPTLLAARAQLRAVDENVPQALAGWRPTVVIAGSAGYSDTSLRSQQTVTAQRDQFGNLLNPSTAGQPFSLYTDSPRDTATLQATVSQPVYRGGRTTASTRRAENQVYGQRARLLATEQQVLLDSVSAYVGVIRDTEVVRLNANNVEVLNRQLQATNERFRVGEITRTDVAQAESRLAGARASLQQAEGNLQSSRAIFVRLIGIEPTRVQAPPPLVPPVRSQQDAVRIASDNNPTVVAAMFEEAAARDFIDVQFSTLLPQVSVNASAFRLDNQNARGARQTGAQVTANLNVPLYQGGAEHAAVRQARQQAQQARQAVADARRLAAQQATQTWESLRTARAQVESVRAQIRAQEIALDGVQREAIVGSRTTLDVLNAEQELLNARVNLVQALATLINASYQLTASIGRLTARDLGLQVQLYDPQAYYNAVRDRWVGTGDYSEAAAQQPQGSVVVQTLPPAAPAPARRGP
ncbi:TolC family outer membrane protein [Neoroseomonas eburnea]|uniref:TolC family outer membrane protein n=1 Tax=Neoroseomonas eburnea TaxID=1346889 RepID=UPI001BA8C402|nr:TolC family outer membrane protein [Neoroseomonas eburnea]